MKSFIATLLFLFTTSFSVHSVAASGLDEVLELTEKYQTLSDR